MRACRYVVVAVLSLLMLVGFVPSAVADIEIGGGDPDTVAPVIESLTLDQTSVDVTGGPVVLNVSAHVTDDKSGSYSYLSIGVREPSGGSGSTYDSAIFRSAGTARDGTYTGTLTIDQYAKPGIYQITCYAFDIKNNVTTTCPDETVVVIDFEPPTIDTCEAGSGTVSTSSGATSVPVTVEASDDAKGVTTVGATLTNEDTDTAYQATLDLTDGDALDGTWTGDVSVPANAPTGAYALTCQATDGVDRDTDTGTTPPTSGGGSTTPPVVTVVDTPLPGDEEPEEPTEEPEPEQPATAADLALTKAVDRTSAYGGDVVTYTLTVTNAAGAATATGTTVTDVLPSELSALDAGACQVVGQVVTCAAGDLAAGASRSFTLTARVASLPMVADDPTTSHQLDEQKQETFLGVPAGQTRSASVGCPGGTFATEGGVRLDAVDQGTSVADVHVLASAPDGDGGWRATLSNATTGQAQAKVWVSCLSRTTVSGAHQHALVVTDGPSSAESVPADGIVTRSCAAGQVALAPSYDVTGGDVIGSYGANGSWTFTVEGGPATGTFGIRCLATRLGAANGHVHDLVTHSVGAHRTVAPGETVEETVSCVPAMGEAKGVRTSVYVQPGLVLRGVDPQAKVRRIRVTNTADEPRDLFANLLCVGIRTTGEPVVVPVTNTATVTTTAPESDLADNEASATFTAYGEGWVPADPAPAAPAPAAPAPAAPAPAAPAPADPAPAQVAAASGAQVSAGRRTVIEVRLTSTAATGVTTTLRTTGKVRADHRTVLRKNAVIATASPSVGAGATVVRIRVSKRIAGLIARGRLRTAKLLVVTADGTTSERVVRLRR